MHAAVSWNNLEIVQFLLQSGANIHIKDEEGDTPLLYCEQPDILLLLLQSGANLSDVNVNGEGLIDKGIVYFYYSFTYSLIYSLPYSH